MKKIILTLVCFSFIFYNLKAENSVVNDQLNPLFTGVPFLTIAPDARAGGMGDIGAATTPDVYSQHWNPSKYAFMESQAGFAFSFTPWLNRLVSDINLSYLVGYWKFDDLQAVSLSMKYFSLGRVQLRQSANDIPTEARPNDFSIDIAYSRLLSEKFSASVGFRYIRSDLDIKPTNDGGNLSFMEPANAWAVDISGIYRTPIELSTGDAFLSVGGNISNIGSKVSYDQKETTNFLPANLKLGVSFDLPFDDYNRLSINADINKLLVPTPSLNDSTGSGRRDLNETSSLAGVFQSFSDAPGGFKEEMQEIMWAIGLEYSYNKQFFVRAGYSHESDYKGGRRYFTAGLGFKLNVFDLNAGYVIATSPANPLDKTLRFSLAFDIYGIKDLFSN